MVDTEEEPFAKDGLTIRQRRFVDALVGPAGGNATKAAQMAGYRDDNYRSLQVTASQTLSKPMVQEALAHAYAKLKMSPEWSKNALQDIASASMANFVTVDENGKTSLDLKKAAEMGALGQIKEWTEEVIDVGEGGPAVIKRKIKLHDRMPAVQALLKLQGLVKESMDHTGEVKVVVEYGDKEGA